jgi:hypothetical protein
LNKINEKSWLNVENKSFVNLLTSVTVPKKMCSVFSVGVMDLKAKMFGSKTCPVFNVVDTGIGR